MSRTSSTAVADDRYGLDDSFRVVMPMADPSWDLASYINFALQIVGSAFTAGEVAGDLWSSPIITTDHQISPKVSVIPEPWTVSIPAYTNITKPYPAPIPVPVLTVGKFTDCPVDETISPTSPITAATASNHITSVSTFPWARKVVSNSADLVAKLADPPIISIRKAMKMNFPLQYSYARSTLNQHNESIPVSQSSKYIPENQLAVYVVTEPNSVNPIPELAPTTMFYLASEFSYKHVHAPEPAATSCSNPPSAAH